MMTKADVRINDTLYSPNEYDIRTTAEPYRPNSIIKYIVPRVIATDHSHSQDRRGLEWSNVGTNFTTSNSALGLASLIQHSTYTTLPSIHSIDNERIVDEHRELSRVNETLSKTLIQCFNLEAHNRVQELQMQWLRKHLQENGGIIEKMFETEMEGAKQLIHDTLQRKLSIETKLHEAEKQVVYYREKDRDLLEQRDFIKREIYDLERKIAQNTAECQLFQRLLRHLDDEHKFFITKTQVLYGRKSRLRYDLDEDLVAQQVLQMQAQVLRNEKVTSEDTHVVSFDDAQNSIDIAQVAGMQPSKYFADHLSEEVERIRTEFEKKINSHREELHRKYEIELHSFQVHQSHSVSAITREHQFKLEQYEREKKDTIHQVAQILASIKDISLKIETIDREIIYEKNKSLLNAREKLNILNQTVHDRERQLEQVIHNRNAFKRQIEAYRERHERFNRQKTLDYRSQRTTIYDFRLPSSSPPPPISHDLKVPNQPIVLETKSKTNSGDPLALSFSSASVESNQVSSRPKRSSVIRVEEIQDDGTFKNFSDFKINQDCQVLNKSLNDSVIDEIGIIQILCNRAVNQRIAIRDTYRKVYNTNLADALERLTNSALSKLLRMLLLSPVEHDCFELKKTIKKSTIDRHVLAEIFFSRSNRHIQMVRERYHQLFRITIDEDIHDDRQSYSKKILRVLLQANRPENNDVDDSQVVRDTMELITTGLGWKADGSPLVRLLCTRSNAHLQQVVASYEQFTSINFESAIQAATQDELYKTVVAIVRLIRNRPLFFAHVLRKSLQDSTADVDTLNRIMVSRSEIDIVQIRTEFERIANASLRDRIMSNTHGNYRRALLEILTHRLDLNSTQWKSELANEPVNRQESNRSPVQWRKARIEADSNSSKYGPITRSVSEHVTDGRRHVTRRLAMNSLGSAYELNRQEQDQGIVTSYKKDSGSQPYAIQSNARVASELGPRIQFRIQE